MGQFNQLLNKFWQRSLAAAGQIEEGESVATLAPELMPTVDVYSHLHLYAPGGAFPWVTPFISRGPTAAVFSEIGFRNPAGSGMIAQVDAIVILHVALVQYNLFIRANAAVTIATQGAVFMDSRFRARRAPLQASVVEEAANTGTGPLHFFEMDVRRTRVYRFPAILHPGFEIYISPATNFTASQGFFIGRAWQAAPGELVNV